MRLAALLLLLVPAACASMSSAPARSVVPRVEFEHRQPDLVQWHVHVDARGRTLGAYTLRLKYDPAIAVIEDIQSCNVRHFRGAPEFDSATFRTGRTRVVGLDANPGLPDGDYHLLTVTFRRVASGTLLAAAEIENLYDGDNKPLSGRITFPRFEHSFR